MCISFCARKRALFLNHDNCPPTRCEFSPDVAYYESCHSCVHLADDVCKITNYPAPLEQGCCHHNVDYNTLAVNGDPVTAEWIRYPGQSLSDIYDDYDVPTDENGDPILLQLRKPYIMGVGTDHLSDDDEEVVLTPAEKALWDDLWGNVF